MGSAAAHYPPLPERALRLAPAEMDRCLLPASATDLRHEHPQTVRFPGAWLSPSRPHVTLTHVQGDNAAPDFLAEIQPQVDTRLTARSNFGRTDYNPSQKEGRAPHRAMLPRRGVFNRVQGYSIRPLTLHVVPYRTRKPDPAKHSELFHSPSRQKERIFKPGVPSIDKCSRRSPPPCSRLSHRRAGFQRSFAPQMLAHCKARPQTFPQILHLWSERPRAACQLLQPKRSATTTTGTVEPRAPRSRCDP
jgi:hypothetical protein